MELLDLVNYAATQNDRWLFLGLLVLVLVACFGLWRWMVSSHVDVTRRLTEVTDRHISQTEKLSEVVANNTIALHEVKAVLLDCRLRNPKL